MKPYLVEITKSRDFLPRKQSITHQTSCMNKIEYLIAGGPFYDYLSFDMEHKILGLWGHLIRKTERNGGCLKSGTKKHKTYSCNKDDYWRKIYSKFKTTKTQIYHA